MIEQYSNNRNNHQPVPVGYIRKWNPGLGGNLDSYDDIPISNTPDTPAPESSIRRVGRRSLVKASLATVAAGSMAAALGPQIESAKKWLRTAGQNYESKEIEPFTYIVQNEDTLTSIAIKFYPEMEGHPDWINSFIDNNIENISKDDRPRDRNTIYVGDILKIARPDQESLDQSAQN